MKEIFNACDLDGNGFIELYEFTNMIQCIEPNKFGRAEIAKIFEDYSDSYEISVDDNTITIRGMILE